MSTDQPTGGAGDLRIAVYPGSFDPPTNGHLDLVRRGARLFDRLIVAVLVNEQKAPLFTVAERVEMLRAICSETPGVEVDTFQGLLVDYATARGATAVVRGLRGVSDFDFELHMSLMNRRMAGGIETVFLMPAAEFGYVSSRLTKEVCLLGGPVTGLVPPAVEARLHEKRAALRARPA